MNPRSESPSRPEIDAIHGLSTGAHAEMAVSVGPIEAWMTGDHARLAELLERADRGAHGIDPEAYAAFRRALARHFTLEEKVLLPFARVRRGGDAHPAATAIRAGHEAILALLPDAPGAHDAPSDDTLAPLRDALAAHEAIEEGDAGLYAACDALAGDEADAVLERLRAEPEVPLTRPREGSLVRIR